MPSDLYAFVVVYYLMLFVSLCFSLSLRSPMIIILDFFLLIFILFLSAHFSVIDIACVSLFIVVPNILVSSAKICGKRSFWASRSSVRSSVNMLNRRQDIPHP